MHASRVLYKRLLESVLFANIRFHDTVSRGRLLNRFGKDFEGIDSNLSDNFGRTIICALSALTTIVTVSFVGGWPFLVIIVVLAWMYYNGESHFYHIHPGVKPLCICSCKGLWSDLARHEATGFRFALASVLHLRRDYCRCPCPSSIRSLL